MNAFLVGNASAVDTANHLSLPKGVDLAPLVRIARDLDDADLSALLAKIFAALPPVGILLFAETPGAEKVGVYFEIYCLTMQRGRPRPVSKLTNLL